MKHNHDIDTIITKNDNKKMVLIRYNSKSKKIRIFEYIIIVYFC